MGVADDRVSAVTLDAAAPPDTARLFLALWLGPAERAVLAGWRDAWQWRAHSALTRPEQWHLTLHFLGDVDRTRLAELGAGLGVAFTPFNVHFGVPELWPRGIAVLRPDGVPDALLQLHARLGEALRHLDLPVEARDYHPHITLARRAGGAVLPVSPPTPAWRWRVAHYALVESARGRSVAPGGGYRVLQTWDSDAAPG